MFQTLFRIGIKLSLVGMAILLLLLLYYGYDLPDTDKVNPLETKPSITILANDGTLIARYGGIKGDTVSVGDLPPHVVAAVLAVEDRRFYNHFGIDLLGFARAMWVNVNAGKFLQGGSTITQQLAKNLFLTPDKTIRRKVQEAMMALWIERKFTKDEILSAYLNRVYFGSGAYGIDAAAKVYFDKSATEVTLWEGAVLAGLLKAPSRYSPTSNPRLARDRAKTVIALMEDAGYIKKATRDIEIKNARIQLAGSSAGSLNRYFGDWVINQIDSFVTQSDGDIVVRTTFDPNLQLLAEEKQKALFETLRPEEKVSQVALVTMAKDGAVLAMIGGTDYTESQFNRASQALRQPGSSFKPFVYLAALEKGFKPDMVIEDAPITRGKYRPKNYDGKYHGYVTLTQALAQSLNTATIRLLQETGVAPLMEVTQRLGFTVKFKPELSTGLGTGEATLLEMTNAYAVIGNGGYAVWPYAVLSVEDAAGSVLYRHENPDHSRVFSGYDIANLDSMLVQVLAQGTGQAAQLSRGHTAGKTGTTQDYRDAWFVGYTDKLVTGIWMGNDDNTSMEKISGGKYPARLWRDYMEQAIRVNVPSQRFTLQPITPAGDGFFDMLNRLSSGSDGEFIGNDAPVPYNQ